MIRIIFLSLLTLTLSCGNTRPEPTEDAAAEPVVETSVQPQVEPPATAPSEAAPLSRWDAARNSRAEAAKAAHARSAEKAAEKAAKKAAQDAAAEKNTLAAGTTATSAPTAEATAAELSGTTTEIEVPISSQTPATLPQTAQAEVSLSETPVLLTAPSGSQVVAQTADKPILASRKHFLPTRRRIDREINKLKFAYKGEVMMGLTASYGTLSSDDTDFLLILNNINANATVATVKPFLGYFYRDNAAVGVRFGYSHINGSLKSAGFDLGPSNDISGIIPKFKIKSNNYAFGVFHRSYAGLDPKGRFGLFAEFELSMSTGSSEFTYESNGVPKPMFSDNIQLKLAFNPGAAVYIFPNVCTTLSFGLGGIEYTSIKQKDAQGNQTGSRTTSKMKFKLNIAAINIGMNVHLWDKKKK